VSTGECWVYLVWCTRLQVCARLSLGLKESERLLAVCWQVRGWLGVVNIPFTSLHKIKRYQKL
jgi:hypothetical protein